MMNTNIAMGQYLPGSSWIHRLDPRTKLICVALGAILVISAKSLTVLVLASLWTLVALGLSGIKAGIYWRSLRPLWILLLISFLLQILFTPGEPLVSLGFIKLTQEGLTLSGWFLWRISTLLLLASNLTFTTTPLQLTAALEWLLHPLSWVRAPVAELAMMINLSLRFVPALFDEAAALLSAQRSRGLNFAEGGLGQRVSKLAPFMVPLLTNMFRYADDLAYAMEIRCYQVGVRRTRMRVLRFASGDYMALTISIVILALALAINFGVSFVA